MTAERAIEILDPRSDVKPTAEEWAEAHRMACLSLAMPPWTPTAERKPESGDFVLGVCTARLSHLSDLDFDVAIVEYDELGDRWFLDGWPEVEGVLVSYWMPLPELPDELRRWLDADTQEQSLTKALMSALGSSGAKE